MQEELKIMLQGVIQFEFSKVENYRFEMTEFLKNFGLPQSLHSLTADSDIPDAIWVKIEEF